MKKQINNEIVDMTAEEIAEYNERQVTLPTEFEQSIKDLRHRRNSLLAETDWMANSDVTISDNWKTYRQALRDLTNGLDTVEKVEAVEFPIKPSGE